MKKHKIHHSLLRTQTFLGCDRHLCMLLFFICTVLGIFSFSVIGVFISASISSIGFFFLSNMAKKDLKIRTLYLRNRKYKSFYSAQGYIYSKQKKKYI